MSGDNMELFHHENILGGFTLHDELSSIFTQDQVFAEPINGEDKPTGPLGVGGGGAITPVTPNTLISSLSNEAVGENNYQKPEELLQVRDQGEDGDDKSKQVNKLRKKGEKRQWEPRVAFMTKSEVDNLEDGYRWRKYGQKPVKNSPYPRSYYRCTTHKCTVKKHVERSYEDPSTVITTYEGQHTHQSPAASRLIISSHLFASPPTSSSFPSSQTHQDLLLVQQLQQMNNNNGVDPNLIMYLQSVGDCAFPPML